MISYEQKWSDLTIYSPDLHILGNCGHIRVKNYCSDCKRRSNSLLHHVPPHSLMELLKVSVPVLRKGCEPPLPIFIWDLVLLAGQSRLSCRCCKSSATLFHLCFIGLLNYASCNRNSACKWSEMVRSVQKYLWTDRFRHDQKWPDLSIHSFHLSIVAS